MNLKVYLTKKENIQRDIEGSLVDYLSIVFDVADLDSNKIVEGLAFEISAQNHPDDDSIEVTASNWVIKHDLFSKYSSKPYQNYLDRIESKKEIALSGLAKKSYPEVVAWIDEITTLVSVKQKLKVMAKVILALVKTREE